MMFKTKNELYLEDLDKLAKLANDLKLQRYSKIESNNSLQADYHSAIKETLAAYNRIAKSIGVTEVEGE